MSNKYTKTVETQTKHFTKAEKAVKIQAQERVKSRTLKKRTNKLKTPPNRILINPEKLSVWKFFVKELTENENSLITNEDSTTLAMLIDSIYLYNDCMHHLETEPQVSTSENKNGQIYEMASTWINLREKHLASIRNLLKDLGISMDARIKMAMVMNVADKTEANEEIKDKLGDI